VLDPGGHFINTNHADMLELANEFGLNCSIELRMRDFLSSNGLLFQWKNPPEAEVVNKLRSLARQISDDADLLDKDQVRTDLIGCPLPLSRQTR